MSGARGLWESPENCIFTRVCPMASCIWPVGNGLRNSGTACSWSLRRGEVHATWPPSRRPLWYSACGEREEGRGQSKQKAALIGGIALFPSSPSPDIYSSNDAPKSPASQLLACRAGSQTAIYFSKDASIISEEKPGYIFKAREQQLLNLFRLMSACKSGECQDAGVGCGSGRNTTRVSLAGNKVNG